jgi:hypothetical protein
VALLGFGSSRCGGATRWRLIVSTGNWTEVTWSRQEQIDFFWMTEWGVEDADDEQALTNVAAAFEFFERLLDRLYGEHLEKLRSQPLAVSWLDSWREALRHAKRRLRKPPAAQFVHSLDASLATQICKRFPSKGINTLVAGSGFLEQAVAGSSTQPEVLRELEHLGHPGTRYLVFNTSQAGQLANWIGKRRIKDGRVGKWSLCQPMDPLQKGKAPGRGFLHAKFIAGLGPMRSDTGRIAFLYIGSGNLSHLGYMSAARLGDTVPTKALGNVEAGVVLTDSEKVDQVWRRLACGDLVTKFEIDVTVAGDGEALFTAMDPPPLLLARHVRGDEAGPARLVLERSAVPAQPLWIRAENGDWIAVAAAGTSVPWPSPTSPTVLRVRACASADGAQQEWQVPVFAADGLFCKRALPQLPFGNVLEALLAFPESPPYVSEEGEEGGDGGARTWGRHKALSYPLRSLAAMIEAIAGRNSAVTREEFLYWLSQLRVLLLEQTADEDRQKVKRLGVDLFDALLEPGFTPTWLNDEPALKAQYASVVDDLRAGYASQSGATIAELG